MTLFHSHQVKTAELLVGRSDDRVEREADRAADHAMSLSLKSLRVQHCASSSSSGQVMSTEKVGHQQSGGQPLPENERRDFSRRFGHDFSQVRIDTDAAAPQASWPVLHSLESACHSLRTAPCPQCLWRG